MRDILADLNIDAARLEGGIEGGVWGIDMGANPEDWAGNLYYLLDIIGDLGIRVSFHSMGSGWINLLGIHQPQSRGPEPMTPLSTALERVDMLAGNNELRYDFLKDRRIWAWCVANELDISVASDLSWCIAVLDRIRGHGAKAYVACPRYANWGPGKDLSATYPLIAGHVDYLTFHHYGISQLVRDYGKVIIPQFAEWYYNELERQVEYCKAIGWPLDKFIFEEFGIWLGYGKDQGVEATFSDEDRGLYYLMALDVAKNLGIRHTFNHQLHEQTNKVRYPKPQATNYAIVAFDGSYYLPAYELKSAYATPIPSLMSLAWLTSGLAPVITVGGVVAVQELKKLGLIP